MKEQFQEIIKSNDLQEISMELVEKVFGGSFTDFHDCAGFFSLGYNHDYLLIGQYSRSGGNSIRCVNNIDHIGLIELKYDSEERVLLKVVDMTGRETEVVPNTVLIYIYSDGSTERIIKLE